MLRGRDICALRATKRVRAGGARGRPLRLSAARQAAVIEALREEFDLLGRGEPSPAEVEHALLHAEADG